MNRLQHLKLRQVDERLSSLRSLSRKPPPSGWIRLIRSTLGMSTRELAERMGITRQALAALEKREQSGEVSLRALHQAAEALDCDLVYAVVPRSRLTDAMKKQALLRAQEEIESTAHSMRLEAQGVSSDETKRLIQDRASQLLVTGMRGFWELPQGKIYDARVQTKEKRRGRPSKR